MAAPATRPTGAAMPKGNLQVDHVTLADLPAPLRPERWLLAQPATLIMMFPYSDGITYLSEIPKLNCLHGFGHNLFAGPQQRTFSVVSLAFWGQVINIGGSWYVAAEGQSQPVKFGKEADLGIIRARIPRQRIAYLL